MSVFWTWLFNLLNSCRVAAVLQPNEGGVITFCGKFPRTVGPGFHFVFPVLGVVTYTDVTEQVIDVRSQSLTTKDGESVAVGISVAYDVMDAYRAIFQVQDRDNSLANETLRIVGDWVRAHTFDECRESDVPNAILPDLRKIATERWGLKVWRVGLSDFAKHRAIRLLGCEGLSPLST